MPDIKRNAPGGDVPQQPAALELNTGNTWIVVVKLLSAINKNLLAILGELKGKAAKPKSGRHKPKR